MHGHSEVVSVLLKTVNIKNPDSLYQDDLSRAAYNGDLAELNLRLTLESKIEEKYSIDINARNKDNQTPLHLAAMNGYPEVVSMLSERSDCAVNAQDNDGRTPLYLAVMNEHPEVVSILLKQSGIAVNAKSKSMNNALHIAAYLNNLEIVLMLLEKSDISDINAKDQDGDTVLNAVILGIKAKKNRKDTIEIITILVMKGALVDVSNTDGKNTRDLAHDLGDQNIIDMLPKS